MVLGSPEFATVLATHDFDPQSLGLNRARSRTLLVYKGDKFKVFSMPSREWWGARCTSNDNIGYIPSAYVRPAETTDQQLLEKKQTAMDVAAIAAIAKEVKINARAKQTGNDKATTELGNILTARQQGAGGPIKPKKQFKEDSNNGMSSELQKMLAKRNKIIEEDEQQKEKDAAEPEFLKLAAFKRRNAPPDEEYEDKEDVDENADENSGGS